jgi:mannose-1-phosphate guanylyltransferase
MKAMIMAAGFGTRLRPLTDNIPKALLPVLNRPVLERNIEYLAGYGIRDIIINAHYHSDQIRKFVSACKIPKVNLTVSHEEEILGTGGGIARCRDFLEGDTFTVINSDILTDIKLDWAVKNHADSGAHATMVLHDCSRFNQIDITPDNRVKKIHRDTAPERLAFTGIHILEPEIFDFLPDGREYADIISSCYNPLIESGRPVNACIVSNHYWYDIGTIESYLNASRDFLKLENMEYAKGDNTRIDPSVKLINWAVIGNNVTVGKNAEIDSSIIWDNVYIEDGARIKDSIVTPTNQVLKTPPVNS